MIKVVIYSFLILFSLRTFAVEFFEILNDPDNVILNEKFAKERLISGDLPAALSAIERVLNFKPTNTPLRLLRSELLIQLGNDALAKTELEALNKLPLGKNQKKQVSKLLQTIKDRQSLTKNSMAISYLASHTNNANAYPSSGQLEAVVNGNRIFNDYSSYDGESKTVSDSSIGTIITLSNEYDLETQNKDLLVSRLSVNASKGENSRYLNNNSFTFQSGMNILRGRNYFLPSISYSLNKGETKADSTNLRLSSNAIYLIDQNTRFNYGASFSTLRYKNDATFTTANLGDGDTVDISIGVDRSLGDDLLFSSRFNQSTFKPDKSQFAEGGVNFLNSQANEKVINGLNLNLTKLISSSARIQLGHTLTLSKNKYPDQVADKIRSDRNNSTSLTLFFSGDEIKDSPIPDWNFMVSFTNTDNQANITQFDYSKKDISIVASHAFDF